MGSTESRAERARKDAAARWFGQMQGPDAERVRAEFDRWRGSDPRNHDAYARLESLWIESARLAETPLGREPVFVRRPSIFAQPGPRIAFASVALAVAVASGAFLLWPARHSPPMVATVQEQKISTSVGEIRSLHLADGSSVTLDTDSAIEVLVSPSGRHVRLSRGRARFDVAHDPSRPFRVAADGQTVTALGTLFDVGLDREVVRVTLLRGSVEVRAASAAAPAAIRLRPGQLLSAAPDGQRIASAPRGGEQWVSGVLSFDGVPLGEVLAETNRYSPRKVRLASPDLDTIRVTGVFRAAPAEQLAASLAATFGLRVVTVANGDLQLYRR